MWQENELRLREKWLCLDFANTNDWHASPHPVESLLQYADLATWCQQVGLVTAAEAQELQREAAKSPLQASAILQRAIALREAIYRIILAHLLGNNTPDLDLELLNAEIALVASFRKLMPAGDGFAWTWDSGANSLAGMLGPIARSAAALLTSPELYRVGMCADEDGCGFLFFDTSRNRSRQWCSMEDCGNRAKAQRHYRRQKANMK